MVTLKEPCYGLQSILSLLALPASSVCCRYSFSCASQSDSAASLLTETQQHTYTTQSLTVAKTIHLQFQSPRQIIFK